MAKMLDMGEKVKTEGVTAMPSKEKQRMDYPTLHLSNKIPEGLFDKKIGDMCELVVMAKLVNKGIDENLEKKRKNLTLEIHQMGYKSDTKEVEDEVKRQLK